MLDPDCADAVYSAWTAPNSSFSWKTYAFSTDRVHSSLTSGRSHVGVLGLGWHLGRLDFARKLWATASRRGLSLGVGAVIELRERGDVRRARAGSRGPRAPACNPPHQLATHKMLPSTQGLPYGWTASTKPAPARDSNKARPRRALLQERP